MHGESRSYSPIRAHRGAPTPRTAPPCPTRLPPYVPIPVPLPKRGWWVGVLLEKSEEEPGMAPLRLFFLSAFNA